MMPASDKLLEPLLMTINAVKVDRVTCYKHVKQFTLIGGLGRSRICYLVMQHPPGPDQTLRPHSTDTLMQ